MSDDAPKRRLPVIDGPVRDDLDDGLRFVHVLGMQVKHDLFEASSKLFALLEELVAKGAIDLASFEKRRARIKEREQARQRAQAHVRVNEVEDKYAKKVSFRQGCADPAHRVRTTGSGGVPRAGLAGAA